LVRIITMLVLVSPFAFANDVERYELPNLRALNFLLHRSLDGGGTRSLMLDAQGKTFSTALLRMEVDLPEEIVDGVRDRMHEERQRWRGEDDGE